jgi:hypothetical protein
LSINLDKTRSSTSILRSTHITSANWQMIGTEGSVYSKGMSYKSSISYEEAPQARSRD